MTTSTPFDFLSFVKDRAPALRRKIRPHVGPHGGELDDVMQDVLSRLWVRRGEFATAEDAERFCLAQAAYVTKDNARRSVRAARASLEAPPLAASDPARVTEAAALLDQVRGVLTERQADVWLGVVVEGRSTEDLAATFGTSKNAVSVALYKAWARLRQHRHLFRSLLAGVVLAPRRRVVEGARPAWCGAVVSVAAGLSILVAPFHARTGRPATARADSLASDTRSAGPVAPWREVRDRPGGSPSARLGQQVSHDHDLPAVETSKVTGCLPAAGLCTGPRDAGRARHGHALWVAAPVVSPQAQEFRQRAVPMCVLAADLPEQETVGCTRYGQTETERGRHVRAAVNPSEEPDG